VIDGRDLSDLLTAKPSRARIRYFHYLAASPEKQINYRGIRETAGSCSQRRRGRQDQAEELYDLGADPGERFDR
jgi:hypothetical protein